MKIVVKPSWSRCPLLNTFRRAAVSKGPRDQVCCPEALELCAHGRVGISRGRGRRLRGKGWGCNGRTGGGWVRCVLLWSQARRDGGATGSSSWGANGGSRSVAAVGRGGAGREMDEERGASGLLGWLVQALDNHVHVHIHVRVSALFCCFACVDVAFLSRANHDWRPFPHRCGSWVNTKRGGSQEPMLMPGTAASRTVLLHLTPATRRVAILASSSSTITPLRTMASKPSLKAAEDFLSFVNASPTRTLPAS